MLPRWSLSCFIFLLLALGGAWAFREAKAAGVGPAAGAWRESGRGESGYLVPGDNAVARTALAGAGCFEKRGEVGRLEPVAAIGAGAAALLTEEIELRALGLGVELSLTEREWAALAGVTLHTQAVRHAYEAEIAVATSREDGGGRLEIPAYAGAGRALRTEFYSALLKELGESAALEIVRKLSHRLESRFAGFGAAVQTLDFSVEGDAGMGVGSVTRTVVFWDAEDSDAASRMRRETVFPAMEDPEGLQWGPLLARVEAAQAQGKKSRG